MQQQHRRLLCAAVDAIIWAMMDDEEEDENAVHSFQLLLWSGVSSFLAGQLDD